jgi:hypothetical protein
MILNAEECRRVLGVPADASEETIRQVYRDLVRVWHPDRFQSDARLRQVAEDNLRKINDAYAALKDGPAAARGDGHAPAAEGRAGEQPAAGPAAAPASEAPPKAAPVSAGWPGPGRLLAHAAAAAACGAAGVWALVRMVALVSVPALDASLGFQPGILTPMRNIDPALGVRGATETLVEWSHGGLVDLWKPAQPVALPPAERPQTAAGGPKHTVGGGSHAVKRSAPALEPRPAPASGSELIGPGRLAGAGELRLANQTDLEAVVKLLNRHGEIVRALYLAPHDSAGMRSIAVGVYTLHVDLGRDLDVENLRFRNERFTPAPLGPFPFLEITSDKGVTGSRFDVALKPRQHEAAVAGGG